MKKIILFFILFALVITTQAQQKSFSWYSEVRDSMVTIPAPERWLNDYEGIFTTDEAALLDRYIGLSGEKADLQFLVVTIDSLFGAADQLREFANALGDKWGVGEKEKNNGVVIVFGRRLRKIWIAPGTGVESRFTPDRLKKIIDETIIPRFKEKDYVAGIMNGISEICQLPEKTKQP